MIVHQSIIIKEHRLHVLHHAATFFSCMNYVHGRDISW